MSLFSLEDVGLHSCDNCNKLQRDSGSVSILFICKYLLTDLSLDT